MTSERIDWERLMAHPSYYKPRRKAPRPISITPPKCDVCRKQRAPGVDHSNCAKEAS